MMNDQKDFPALYLEYYPKVVGYLRRIVGEAEAEDVAQEAFVKVSRSLGSFRGESRLSTWIYRIATNAAMDHLRRPSTKHSSRQGDGAADGGGERDDDFVVDGAPLHDTLLIRKDMNECIRGLVNDLPENYRAVLVLADLEGFTNAETGDVLGLSLDTVKIRLHRARLQLKKSMDHACHLYRDARNELSCDRKSTTLEFKKR
jgi:RNA polymerase sigma-70 factor (ECF subfamily)